MIQTSSKRLSRIKKKLKKNDTVEYSFLLKSLERQSNKQKIRQANKQNIIMNKQSKFCNKQNYLSNKAVVRKGSLSNSTQLIKSSLVNSFEIRNQNAYENSYCSKIKMKNNPISFFQNTKLSKQETIQYDQFKNSIINKKQPHQPLNSLELTKHAKWIDSQQVLKTNKLIQKNTYDQFSDKLQTYFQFVGQLFDQIKCKCVDSKIQRKRNILTSLSKQLIEQYKKLSQQPNEQIKPFSQSIQISNFTTYNSKTISKDIQKSCQGLQNYKKIISNLSQQKSKLQLLISQHQKQNIKMFIKINDNESQEIQNCKRYLGKLFDKYKVLEKMIIKQTENTKRAKQQTNIHINKFIQKQHQNNALLNQIQELKRLLIQQTQHKISFQQDCTPTIFKFNINQCKRENTKQQKQNVDKNMLSVQEKVEKNFATKRQKASSCLSTHINDEKHQKVHKQEDISSCATLTKAKNMKKKTQKSKGVNLKYQFTQTKQEDDKKMKQILLLKKSLNDQKNQKQCLKRQKQQQEQTIQKQEQKIIKMQVLIKDQLQSIEKVLDKNKQLSSQLNRQKLQQKNFTYQTNLKSKLFQFNNFQFNNIDQYRIIALQASVLEKLI